MKVDKQFPAEHRTGWEPSPLLPASCVLALLLIVAKAATLRFSSLAQFPHDLLTLVAASWSDVTFAMACGLVGELLLGALRRSRLGGLVVRVIALALLAIFAGYAVAAVGLFHYFNRPLTYDLLGLVDNAATVRSSIVQRITAPIALGLLGAPAILMVAALTLTLRKQTVRLTVALGLVWIVIGRSVQSSGWETERLEFLALSPHAEFFRSTLVHLVGKHRPSFPKDFPPEYTDEFRTFGGRRARPSSGFQLPPGTQRPRNVIVVVLESVGTKYLGLYGNPTDVAPNLTAAAQNALVFDNIYAHASFTYASFRPVNFSVYPGLPWHYALLQDARPLPKTLASVMRARGSRTAYFTSGDLDWGDQRWLLERGGDFETVQGAADLACPLLSSWGAEDRCVFDRLIEWTYEKPGEPFFAVCWTDQTHDPFLSGPNASQLDFFGAKKRPPFAHDLSRYLNNLHGVDAQIGRLLASLRERGLADDTLVVITGDHGEAFADPHRQHGHAWSVYEEETHVPLLLWNPRLFPEPGRAATIGGHVDLNPTLADLLNVAPPNEWQGYSLFDSARPPRAFFMAIAGGNVFGVREGSWKYFYDVTSGRESFFDLAADPREQLNVAPNEGDRCFELRQRVAAWVNFEDAYLWGREN